MFLSCAVTVVALVVVLILSAVAVAIDFGVVVVLVAVMIVVVFALVYVEVFVVVAVVEMVIVLFWPANSQQQGFSKMWACCACPTVKCATMAILGKLARTRQAHRPSQNTEKPLLCLSQVLRLLAGGPASLGSGHSFSCALMSEHIVIK